MTLDIPHVNDDTGIDRQMFQFSEQFINFRDQQFLWPGNIQGDPQPSTDAFEFDRCRIFKVYHDVGSAIPLSPW